MDDLPDRWRILIAFFACLFAIYTQTGYAHTPPYPNTEKLILINHTTLKAVPTLPLKFASYASLVPGADTYNLYDLINRYDWNPEIAYRIMVCESKGNPEAHNFSHKTKDDSWGLFQINLYGRLADNRPIAEWLIIPENNIAYAYEIYQEQGWGAWNRCYKYT